MTAKDFLIEPYFKESTKRMLCQCGDLQCHNNPVCHNCGGKFNIETEGKSLKDLIEMKSSFKQWGNLNDVIRWFYALNERRMKGITLGEFTKTYKEMCGKIK